MPRSLISSENLARCIYSLISFSIVSLCLFFLSILSCFILRRYFLPVTTVDIPMPLGLPSFDQDAIYPSDEWPSSLVSSINLTDQLLNIDISTNSYQVQLDCSVPRSYRNRQIGSFFVHLTFSSKSKEIFVEHSRLILFPYQSNIVRFVRILLNLPLTIIGWYDDYWYFQETLIERLHERKKPKNPIETIRLSVFPSTFQIEHCRIHLNMLDLTRLTHFFIDYPLLSSVFVIFVCFSIYICVYLFLLAVSMIRSM